MNMTDTITPGYPVRGRIRREDQVHMNEQPSPTMQQLVMELAEKHQVDLDQLGADLELELPDGSTRLIINRLKVDLDLLLVARMVPKTDGFWVEDPSLLFITTSDGWIPFEIVFDDQLWESYATHMSETDIPVIDRLGQPIMSNFTEYMAQQLINDKWLEDGQWKPSEKREIRMLQQSKLMAGFVHDLEQKYPAQSSEYGFYLELSMMNSWLVLREEEPGQLYAVGYLRTGLNGIPQLDPEILFYIEGETRWCPISMHRYWEGDVVVADVDVEQGCVTVHDPPGQQRIAEYANVLANSWRQQGWTQYATITQLPPEPEEDEIPF